jgi:hypothetical protein
MKKRPRRKLVHLVAYQQNGRQVLEQFLDLDDYYEESHPLLDDVEFRMARKIIRIRGKHYDAASVVVEEFELRYNDAGVLIREATRLGDGTVIGNWDESAVGG